VRRPNLLDGSLDSSPVLVVPALVIVVAVLGFRVVLGSCRDRIVRDGPSVARRRRRSCCCRRAPGPRVVAVKTWLVDRALEDGCVAMAAAAAVRRRVWHRRHVTADCIREQLLTASSA
jgi:hypothetical protein